MKSGLLKEPISLSLLSYSGDVNFSLISLLLTGRASPHLHNGTQYRSKDDHTVSSLYFSLHLNCFLIVVFSKTVEATGVTIRSPIGLLIWMRTEEKTANYSLGSRLKTPVFPVWLVVASEQCGVLFSDDRELLRDYRSEIRFLYNSYQYIFFVNLLLVFTNFIQIPIALLFKYTPSINSCDFGHSHSIDR